MSANEVLTGNQTTCLWSNGVVSRPRSQSAERHRLHFPEASLDTASSLIEMSCNGIRSDRPRFRPCLIHRPKLHTTGSPVVPNDCSTCPYCATTASEPNGNGLDPIRAMASQHAALTQNTALSDATPENGHYELQSLPAHPPSPSLADSRTNGSTTAEALTFVDPLASVVASSTSRSSFPTGLCTSPPLAAQAVLTSLERQNNHLPLGAAGISTTAAASTGSSSVCRLSPSYTSDNDDVDRENDEECVDASDEDHHYVADNGVDSDTMQSADPVRRRSAPERTENMVELDAESGYGASCSSSSTRLGSGTRRDKRRPKRRVQRRQTSADSKLSTASCYSSTVGKDHHRHHHHHHHSISQQQQPQHYDPSIETGHVLEQICYPAGVVDDRHMNGLGAVRHKRHNRVRIVDHTGDAVPRDCSSTIDFTSSADAFRSYASDIHAISDSAQYGTQELYRPTPHRMRGHRFSFDGVPLSFKELSGEWRAAIPPPPSALPGASILVTNHQNGHHPRSFSSSSTTPFVIHDHPTPLVSAELAPPVVNPISDRSTAAEAVCAPRSPSPPGPSCATTSSDVPADHHSATERTRQSRPTCRHTTATTASDPCAPRTSPCDYSAALTHSSTHHPCREWPTRSMHSRRAPRPSDATCSYGLYNPPPSTSAGSEPCDDRPYGDLSDGCPGPAWRKPRSPPVEDRFCRSHAGSPPPLHPPIHKPRSDSQTTGMSQPILGCGRSLSAMEQRRYSVPTHPHYEINLASPTTEPISRSSTRGDTTVRSGRVGLIVDNVRFVIDAERLQSHPDTMLGRMLGSRLIDDPYLLSDSTCPEAIDSDDACSTTTTTNTTWNHGRFAPDAPSHPTSDIVIAPSSNISAQLFRAILDYYLVGHISCPPGVPVPELKEACDYFLIPFTHTTVRCGNLRAFLHELSNDGAHVMFERFLEEHVLPVLVKCAQLGERECHVVIVTDDATIDWDPDYPPQMPENELHSNIIHSTQMFRFLKYIENRDVAKQVLVDRGLKKIRIGIEGYPTSKDRVKFRPGMRPEAIYNYVQCPFLRMSWEEEENKSRHVDFQCVKSKSVSDLTSGLEQAVVDPLPPHLARSPLGPLRLSPPHDTVNQSSSFASQVDTVEADGALVLDGTSAESPLAGPSGGMLSPLPAAGPQQQQHPSDLSESDLNVDATVVESVNSRPNL